MTITKNCLVTLDYTVFDTENNLIDSGANPLVYLHGGYNDVFEKIEKALDGKQIGDSFHLNLLPQDSFGEYQQDLVMIEDPSHFAEDIEVGQTLEMVFTGDEGDDEIMLAYTIVEITPEKVVLDANHPLAGMTSIFDAAVIGVREATSDEIEKRLIAHEEESFMVETN